MRRPFSSSITRLVAGVVLLSQGGCMSALTSATLREAVFNAVDSLADVSVGGIGGSDDADVSARVASDDGETAGTPEPVPTLSLDEAVDRAVARLKAAGELDAATQATLLSILESTQPEDWPAAIDAFTASLEKHRPASQAAAAAQDTPTAAATDAFVVPTAFSPPAVAGAPTATPSAADRLLLEPEKLAVVETARPAIEPLLPAAADPPSPPTASEMRGAERDEEPVVAEASAPVEQPRSVEPAPPVVDSPADAEPTPVAGPTPVVPGPSLVVRNACFASRVRAWGVVDRFAEAAFRPGQHVIVYFELDAPAVRTTAAGHATSIDTLFRLVASDGRQLGQWDFEPIDETCHAARRDYFARYILQIPDDAPPGLHRLEGTVIDLVAGTSVPLHLDLEVR